MHTMDQILEDAFRNNVEQVEAFLKASAKAKARSIPIIEERHPDLVALDNARENLIALVAADAAKAGIPGAWENILDDATNKVDELEKMVQAEKAGTAVEAGSAKLDSVVEPSQNQGRSQ